MTYLIAANIWSLIIALVIGFAVGAWIWARPRHRITFDHDDNVPAMRTLQRTITTAPLSVSDKSEPAASASASAAPAPHLDVAVRPADPDHIVGALVSDELASPFLHAPEGDPDDLRRLKGVGPKLNTILFEIGVFHYRQIAAWSDGEVSIVDERLGTFKGRIDRDRWREQAKLLAEGKLDEFEQMFGAGSKPGQP